MGWDRPGNIENPWNSFVSVALSTVVALSIGTEHTGKWDNHTMYQSGAG